MNVVPFFFISLRPSFLKRTPPEEYIHQNMTRLVKAIRICDQSNGFKTTTLKDTSDQDTFILFLTNYLAK